ncbi:MAG TPA: histidine kinase dimerization/phospho-acceptor domain-containing protein, partial [Euzebya sp.]|nr:histidine kinase dimerization/phospho-acceptor domain-containing protein [Euzebya sp.]
MLRRTRFTLPLLAALAAVLGGLLSDRIAVVAGVMFLLGVAVDAALARVEETRLARLADQVVAFASEEERPPELVVEGGREWKRMVAALNEVARILRERFEALRSERGRVQRLLDVMPTAVLLFTAEGLAYANPQANALLELDDPIGQTPLRALGVTALQQAIDEAAETGRSITVHVTRDDRELMANATRIAPTEIAMIVTDLTEVLRVEAMRRDFVANASHELKTPVTGIQALADSLRLAMVRDPERARSMVERIQLEATRLARLVRDLLDLTRLEEGSDGRTRQRVPLAYLCAQQIERLEVLAEQADVRVRLVDDGAASVVGVPEDLKLITGNLIQNAI